MNEFINKVSVWLDTYDICRGKGSLDPETVWGTVVHTLLETSGWIHQGFASSPNGGSVMGITRVVIHTIDEERISDALGIRSVGGNP